MTFFKLSFGAIALSALVAFSCQSPKDSNNEITMTPPVAPIQPETLITHNDTRIDNYFWMRLSDEQKAKGEADPQTKMVLEYLRAENDYTAKIMQHTDSLQKKLYDEMVGRIDPTDESVPYKFNGYFYYSRFDEGKEYPLYCRKKGTLDAPEEIMLNVPELAKPYSYYANGSMGVSPDNKILGYSEDTLSRRIYTIKFKNLETGENLADQIPGTAGNLTWANDNKTVFYSVRDAALRSFKIFSHVLGTDPKTDVEVFHEADETFTCYVTKSKSEQYIIIGSRSTLTTEYRVLDANKPQSEWKIIQPRTRGLEYQVSHFGDHFYITTNLDAKNFRLMKTLVDKTEKENWVEVIPHRSDVLLEGIEIFKDFLVVEERKNGLGQIRIMPWSGAEEHFIEFQDEAYMAYTSTNMDFDTEILRIGYTSLTTPNSVYDYNMKDRSRELLKQQKVIGGYNASEYHSERLMVTARDGSKVPVSLVYKKEFFKKDGTSPLLLYGYGSYGNTLDPYFSSVRLSLLDRGFVYAIAHIRGGQEMGRDWYEDGKLMKKINTFNDFIDCGEFLVKEKYAAPDQLHAMGGSAGGLLMGAVINMRPDLWAGVVAAVPFVDVVSTMLDESIPLTTGEFDEWGNPKEEAYYHYMKSYSPYDNIQPVTYPNVLITTGYWDSQVQYWEPAKWIAKLRAQNTGNNLLLLHTNLETGHGGASGRFEQFKETALEFAFLLKIAGKAE
jgi:oligopeptidase B